MRDHPRSDDPDVIERELRETRARVDRTIDQIQDRLSPGQLLDEGLRYFRNGPSDYLATFGSNFSHSVRDNPLPVAMIGLGFAWLALGRRDTRSDPYARSDHYGSYRGSWYGESGADSSESSAERARAAAERLKRNADETEEAFEHRRQQAMAKILDVKEQAGESLDDLKNRVGAAMSEASARWEEMKESIRRRTHDMRDSASHGMAQARDAVSSSWSSSAGRTSEMAGRTSDMAIEIFERQPLLAAAAGVTVGALLGSLFPTTERENELLGPHREDLKRRTKEFGKEAAHTAKEAGRAAAEAGLHEVDRAMGEAESSGKAEDRPSSAVTEHQRHIGGPSGGAGSGGASGGGVHSGPTATGQRPL